MSNLDELLARAETIGSNEVPTGSGNSPEIQSALMSLFEKHPAKWFRSKDLQTALTEAGYQCKKVSDILFAMKKSGKIKQARKGIYGLDANNELSSDTPADSE